MVTSVANIEAYLIGVWISFLSLSLSFIPILFIVNAVYYRSSVPFILLLSLSLYLSLSIDRTVLDQYGR